MEIQIEECPDATWKVHAAGGWLSVPSEGAAVGLADLWMTAWKKEVPVRLRRTDGTETVAKPPGR